MTAERSTTRLISSWLHETTDSLPDNAPFFDHWLDQLPAIEQRHGGRRLLGRRTACTDTSRLPGAVYQPTPIPSGVGRSPSVTGRTQPMFSATKFIVASVVMAVFGAVLLGGLLTQQPSDESVPAVAVSPSPTASYVVTDISDVVTDMGVQIATDDALWLSDEGSVYRMDAASGEVTEVPLEIRARWLLSTDDAIWAADLFQVKRIDRADLSVDQHESIMRSRGEPFMWGRGDGTPIIARGSLWIASPGSESHALVEIDLATQTIRGEYVADDDWSVTDSGEEYEPWMAAIGDAIWIHSEGLLTRFDLVTRTFTDRIDIPGQEAFPLRFGRGWSDSGTCCIATDDAIWLPHPSGSLRRFDVVTLDITDTLELGPGLGAGVAAAGAIWIPVYENGDDANAIHRIDVETRQVTDVIAVDSRRTPAFLHGAIWVEGEDTLSRIDVATLEVTDVITLPTTKVVEPLASEGVIWAFTEEGGGRYRIDGGAAIE